jgi:Na+/phosphate symporter
MSSEPILDPEVIKAIHEAVSEVGQPDAVAEKLVAWLESMSTSELSATDKTKKLELVYSAMKLEEIGEEE